MTLSFGVTKTAAGITAGLLQSVEEGQTGERAEARTAAGAVAAITAYSRTKTASAEFIVDSGDTLPDAGDSVVIGGTTGLCTDVSSREENTGFKSGRIAVETKDSATLTALA